MLTTLPRKGAVLRRSHLDNVKLYKKRIIYSNQRNVDNISKTLQISLHLQVNRPCISLEYLYQFFQLYLILSPTLLAETELCIPTHTRCHNSRGKLDFQLEEMWIYQQICVDKFVCFHSFDQRPACFNKNPILGTFL